MQQGQHCKGFTFSKERGYEMITFKFYQPKTYMAMQSKACISFQRIPLFLQEVNIRWSFLNK
jgi:hypothetical protein